MTDRRMDLVLVRLYEDVHDKPWLFKAPAHSAYLEEGVGVTCDTQYGKKSGEVIARYPAVIEGSRAFDFIVKACGATKPIKRVIGYMRPVDYVEFLEGDE